MEFWIDKLFYECGYTLTDAVKVAVDFASKNDYEGLSQYTDIAKRNYERRRNNVPILQSEPRTN